MTKELGNDERSGNGEREEGEVCVICQKEESFHREICGNKYDFDKCFQCAMIHRDELLKELEKALSVEQMPLFKKWLKASEEFSSMVIFM